MQATYKPFQFIWQHCEKMGLYAVVFTSPEIIAVSASYTWTGTPQDFAKQFKRAA